MSRDSDQKQTTDREQVIEWYRENIGRYREMIGEKTEFGTVVTDSLIRNLEKRIKVLHFLEYGIEKKES